MRQNDPVSKIMIQEPDTVQVKHDLDVVYRLMSSKGLHHVPVLNGREYKGVISFSDVMRVNMEMQNLGANPGTLTNKFSYSLKDIINCEIATLSLHHTVSEVAEIMSAHNATVLPVVCSNNNLYGLVRSSDIIRHLRK